MITKQHYRKIINKALYINAPFPYVSYLANQNVFIASTECGRNPVNNTVG